MSTAGAAVAVRQISSDPFTNPTSQHETDVEPDTFGYGSTVVAAFQAGRFQDGGGASGIGFSTSNDSGGTWTEGFLPSLTANSSPAGSLERATDPSVTYDALHGVWLISTLGLNEPYARRMTSLYVSRSADGLVWGPPITVAPETGSFAHDKNWIVCDNWPSSPFRGRCYITFADFGHDAQIVTATSIDGGTTWSAPVGSSDAAAHGGGPQPVVQPDGTLVVPFIDRDETELRAIRSNDGGQSFGAVARIASVLDHKPTGMRAPPLPSVEVDGAGRVFVAWQDCRFRVSCVGSDPAAPNDIVYSTSHDGLAWTPATRVPIDSLASRVDHFLPGLGVDPASEGANARLALAYYTIADTPCTPELCRVQTGFVSSADGGESWSPPATLSPQPMALSSIADTGQGRMLGDYISTSFAGGWAVPVFPLASPFDLRFRQAIFSAAFDLRPPPSSAPPPPQPPPPPPGPVPAAPPWITISASRSVVTFGERVTVSGRVSSRRENELVALTGVGTVATGPDGVWKDVVTPRIFTTYEARWGEATSALVSVSVRPRVSLAVRSASFSTTVAAARSLAGRFVLVQRRVAGSQLATQRWATVRRVVLGRRSAARFRLQLPRGRSTLRAVLPQSQAGIGYLAGYSPTLSYGR